MNARLARFTFDLMFRFPLTRAALYSRQPFPRWPYMFTPAQLEIMGRLLLSVKAHGAVVEIGCNQGWTSVYFLETLKNANIERPFIGIDTFEGFLPDDLQAESSRGHSNGSYRGYFMTCKRRWYEHSLRKHGYRVGAFQADAGTFDYSAHAPIAFALMDVDLYRPTLFALRRVWPSVTDGGVVVVDDCDPAHELWEGAHQAYQQFAAEVGAVPEIVAGKLGILRKMKKATYRCPEQPAVKNALD